MLAGAVGDLELYILNFDDATHFKSTTNYTSVIDLAVYSLDIFHDFYWKVLEDLCGSDHYPIVISSPEVVLSTLTVKGHHLYSLC